MKIEPIRIEEIKEAVEIGFAEDPEKWSAATASIMALIMGWAYERARGNRAGFWLTHPTAKANAIGPDHETTVARYDWLNEVLDEIGWPKEGR